MQLLKPCCIAALALCALAWAQQKPDIQADSDMVRVTCSVADHNGSPVRNLTVQDFTLADNGQPREIRDVRAAPELPLTLALIADISGKQVDYITEHREAIAQFLRHVTGPRDRLIIVQVARQAWLLSDITGGSADGLDAAVAKIGTHQGKQTNLVGPTCRNVRIPHSCGETALWHALYHTAAKVKPAAGRKAIVVLSDGVDTGSDVTLTDVIQGAQSAGVVVYSMKYSSPASLGSIGKVFNETFSKGLDRIDRETGGMTLSNTGKKIAEDFSRIESDLQNMYMLAFTPPGDARDGKFHKLEVKVARGNPVVRGCPGYWAETGQ